MSLVACLVMRQRGQMIPVNPQTKVRPFLFRDAAVARPKNIFDGMVRSEMPGFAISGRAIQRDDPPVQVRCASRPRFRKQGSGYEVYL